MNNEDTGRKVPISDLDFNYMVTDTVWGKHDINPELKRQLTKTKTVRLPKGARYLDENGKVQISDGEVFISESKSLWDILAIYTQDLRLGNLNPFWGETKRCMHYVDLASELIQENMISSFTTGISRVASQLELSQSNRGFLRRQMNTFTHKSQQQIMQPPKRSLFGKAPKEEF